MQRAHRLSTHAAVPPASSPATAAGGYIRLSLEIVAGTGALESVEIRKSPMAVSPDCGGGRDRAVEARRCVPA